MLLELEYPDLVSKLALLLGAGMTLQGAFRKIAGAYGQKRTQNKTAEMPAYEEMLVACRQMESGVGEQRAYEHFGERCGVASYRKLAGILTQNLQKGTRGITVCWSRKRRMRLRSGSMPQNVTVRKPEQNCCFR